MVLIQLNMVVVCARMEHGDRLNETDNQIQESFWIKFNMIINTTLKGIKKKYRKSQRSTRTLYSLTQINPFSKHQIDKYIPNSMPNEVCLT